MLKIPKLKIVTKYVLKEFLLTFSISFLFFFIIFFINHILVNIKPLLEKSIPYNLVAMMMITFFPMIIIYCLPFGTMLATLMTMGRFSSDNEIIAFRALGFNYFKLFIPIFICGIMITIITFIVNDRLVPISWQKQMEIMQKIGQIKPTLNFKSKTVKNYMKNPNKPEDMKIIFTDIVKENDIEGVFIIDKDSSNQKRIITAKNAKIISDEDRKGIIELNMTNTMILLENKDRPNEFNFGYADSIMYIIDLQDFEETNSKNIPGIAKSTIQNFQEVKKYKRDDIVDNINKNRILNTIKEDTKNLLLKSEDYLRNKITYENYIKNIKEIDTNVSNYLTNDTNFKNDKNWSLNATLIEFYRKFTNPFACIIFAIFAAPIGIYSRRAGSQIGFIIGLFLTAFYWFSFSGTMLMGRRFILTPFISMSLPNLIFLIIGVIFLYKRLKE